jgi:hypothetical protein
MSIQPCTRIGPYEVTSTLGEGGMGVVFRAHFSSRMARCDAAYASSVITRGVLWSLIALRKKCLAAATSRRSLNKKSTVRPYRAGSLTDQVAISMDWFPTLLAAAGTSPDPAYPPDGISLLPLLTQNAAAVPRKLVWRYKASAQRATATAT